MKVTDNFLSPETFQMVQSLMLGPQIAWMYADGINSISANELTDYQFVHPFYQSKKIQSKHFINVIDPFLHLISPEAPKNVSRGRVPGIIRIKANLLPRTEQTFEHPLHTDFIYPNSKTAIFYLNTCNGYTRFEDGSKVESVANRIVEFDCKTLHGGSTCTNAKVRSVINFNYWN